MNQSFTFLLSYVKAYQSWICARVPQSSSLPQSCAEEKSSGVEIGQIEQNNFFYYSTHA